MFLIILGSIGFPVLLEVKAYIKNRIPNFRFHYLLKLQRQHTYSYLFFEVIIILVLEHNHVYRT